MHIDVCREEASGSTSVRSKGPGTGQRERPGCSAVTVRFSAGMAFRAFFLHRDEGTLFPHKDRNWITLSQGEV